MTLKNNIFQNREGAIYKDLACLTHEERINYLQDFIARAMDNYFRFKNNQNIFDYKRMTKMQLGLVQFYLRLIKVCENNKETCSHDMCHIENHHPSINKICQCEKCENSLFEKEIEEK